MAVTIGAADLMARLGEPGLLLVDVRSQEAWRRATIPDAVHLDVYDYFIPQEGPPGVTDAARAAWAGLVAIGADRARTVVYFEEQTGMISPRGLWFHEFAGLEGGVVLDGGLAAWTEAGGPLAPGHGASAAIAPGTPGDLPSAARYDLIATSADISRAGADGSVVLDVRRRTEFTGDFVHPCCKRAGRIPGCVHLFWEDLLSDGRYRPQSDVAALARAAGLSRDKTIVTYCHRGARAATALYALRLAGYDRVRVYVGSWHEWADNPDLPIEAGETG